MLDDQRHAWPWFEMGEECSLGPPEHLVCSERSWPSEDRVRNMAEQGHCRLKGGTVASEQIIWGR